MRTLFMCKTSITFKGPFTLKKFNSEMVFSTFQQPQPSPKTPQKRNVSTAGHPTF